MPKWTDEQKQVIDSRGQSLLVSAAAGSGKTAVLVERIMRKILDADNPVDIDRMLVVTFTNAAAASLRDKIRARLEDEAAGDDPKKARLAMRQLSMLAGDHIETIDRFCREIVLDHADALELDPSFRIGDEGELSLLQSETVSQIIEESLSDPDEAFRESVLAFARLYAPGKTDRQLEELILAFYRFSMSHEFPRVWRRGCAQQYRMDAADTAWMKYLMERIRMQLIELRESLREGLNICMAPGGPYHYTQAMADHADLLDRLVQCGTMEERADMLGDYTWTKPGAKKRKAGSPVVDPVLEAQAKDIRNRAKDELDHLVQHIFFAPEDRIEAMRQATARHMDVLIHLTDRFEERFGKEKEARGIADFSDVAHWALRVLIRVDEDGMPVLDESGSYIRTRIADEYTDYFREIYIDEYQDSNRVQEILLQSIARPKGRFMVGDMKQSIYRFRMADTGIFLEKARSYAPDADASERRIDLHRNFRSRPEVLDTVNLVFNQVMRREIGGVEYTADEELKPGFEKFLGLGEEMLPELILSERGDVPDAASAAETEAAVVAQHILSMVGRMPVYDKEKDVWRPARYEDITILLRTASGWAETFSRVLDEHGIPNRPDANTGYFDAVEVRTILSYLNVLDNPRQDIPLAACLLSMIGDMDERELSLVRAGMGKMTLYDCIAGYREAGEDPVIRGKIARFLDMTNQLRALVKDTPIHLLLWEIYDRTLYEDRIAAAQGGRQKAANLELLADMAMRYEQTSYRGLFHFVRYIEKLRKAQRDIGQAAEGGSRENLVRIMTMHKSKGLEFPIVFVSALAKRFNLQDAQGMFVMHEHLGAGLDYRDAELMGKMPNRIHGAISDRIRMDSIGEELRVLYVAMTRAQQKLILTGCVDERKKAVEKALSVRINKEMKLPGSVIRGASCMMDWILAAYARHETQRPFFDSGRWEGAQFKENDAAHLSGNIEIYTGAHVLARRTRQVLEEEDRLEKLLADPIDGIADPGLHERLWSMFSQGYAWSEGRDHMPAKLSVSEIKHEAYAAELRRIMEEDGGAVLTPEEGSGEENAGAALGSIYHMVLADLDLKHEHTAAHIRARLETMRNCDKITKEDADRIDAGRIEHFLGTDLGMRMRRAAKADMLRREQPFVIGKNAGSIRPEWSNDEQILIQGIIDAFFIEEDEIVLIDYKTDRARPGDEESLVRRYRVQFEIYARALESLLRRRVKEAWLYSLSLGKAVPVELPE